MVNRSYIKFLFGFMGIIVLAVVITMVAGYYKGEDVPVEPANNIAEVVIP